METNADMLAQVEEKLHALEGTVLKPAFVGFDGFIDSIRKAVRTRKNYGATYFDTISDFATRIGQAAGKSGQIEMEEQLVKHGGNAPILAHALGLLGVDSVCMGSMGFPELHPLFENLSHRCKPVSILPPGHSDAVEFDDGKLIFSNLNTFERYNWKYIRNVVGLRELREIVYNSKLIALVDWANVAHAGDIWEGLLEDVIKPSGRHDFVFFFDLCDPSRKTPQQIDEILDVMGSYSSYGQVVLGLNENETKHIWCAIEGADASCETPALDSMASRIYHAMNINCLMIHPIDRTIAFQPHQVFHMKGRVVRNPRVQTGGGDNLNAGFCLGLLAGMSLPECMIVGMAASGHYVETGSSASIEELREYLMRWRQELTLPGKKTRAHAAKITE